MQETRNGDAMKTGIASIGIQFPPLAMPVEDLARLRGEDPNKYTVGLGCKEMALCPSDYGVVELAVQAARRAIERWGGSLDDIGLIAVGTETSVDMSRPLSAWVASELGIKGAIRSYEVKHACYGGTLALRQAVEWRLSGAARGKSALVIASDVSLYAQGDPGEPTQGAGAVAMIVGEPLIAEIDPISYAYSEPAFDFWRPVGHDYPLVEGPLSLECYQRATSECFSALIGDNDPEEFLRGFAALCFHVPFPKMVKKAVQRLGESFGWDEATTRFFFEEKVDPTMSWNRRCGNAYTAALWISVAQTLKGLREGERITAFSYGSGFGAELLVLRAGPLAKRGEWANDVEGDFKRRSQIDAKAYAELRA